MTTNNTLVLDQALALTWVKKVRGGNLDGGE